MRQTMPVSCTLCVGDDMKPRMATVKKRWLTGDWHVHCLCGLRGRGETYREDAITSWNAMHAAISKSPLYDPNPTLGSCVVFGRISP